MVLIRGALQPEKLELEIRAAEAARRP
jgi:hypothetical protein